ncbi:hypothetical protein ACE3MS_19740 [Paenibacillus dendritiformis]|uniref:hypothetical protein n=1 Tax=Paenibacillus dendritiformis TaxID=130049 RepID=UPI00365FA728
MDQELSVPLDDLETSDDDPFQEVTYDGEPFFGIGYEKMALTCDQIWPVGWDSFRGVNRVHTRSVREQIRIALDRMGEREEKNQ